MFVIFLFCVAVQYNDPDPIRWMTIYGLAAICCLLFVLRKLPRYLPIAVALAAFVWALTIVPTLIGKAIPMKEVFGTMHMLSPGVEEAREMGGLLIVTFWMVLLFFKSRNT
jgi:Transmembrane family 220, helix